MEDLKRQGLYRERIMTEIFNAYMDEPWPLKRCDELCEHDYRVDAEHLGADMMWKYKDPRVVS